MPRSHDERVRKIFATIIVVAVVAIVLFATARYFTALFAAFLLFFLFKPVYSWFHHKKKFSRGLSASLVITIILLGIIVPVGLVTPLVVQQIGSGITQANILLPDLLALDARIESVDLAGLIQEQYSALGSFTKTLIVSALDNATKLLISLFITFFVLYFMFVESEHMDKKILKLIPFNEKNARRLWLEFRNVTHATVISTGLIALMQGILLGIGFAVFGIKGAVFWGFIAVLISLLPIVGVPLIWIPAGLIYLLAENYFAGIGILIWGSIISTIDNFLRPWIQKRVGQVHPLTTVIGIFIGLPLFGLIGLVLGPLLISYALLITQMYLEEYV